MNLDTEIQRILSRRAFLTRSTTGLGAIALGSLLRTQQAQAATGPLRQRILQTIVQTYPHTDAAIEAMQLMEGEVVKRASNR